MGHTGSAAPTPLRLPQRATRQDSAAFLGVATFSVMPPTPIAPAHQGSRREGSAMDSENPSSSKSGLRVFKRESNKLFKKSAPVNNPIFFRETHQGHTKVNLVFWYFVAARPCQPLSHKCKVKYFQDIFPNGRLRGFVVAGSRQQPRRPRVPPPPQLYS